MLIYIYLFLAIIFYIIASPFLFFISLSKKYRISIPARFFLIKNTRFKQNGIWFHSCSLGETKALEPLIKNCKEPVNITVITNTGFDEAKRINKSARFLPYEIFLPFWITKQKVLIVMEAELWLAMFFFAKKMGIKTYLLNARINTHSYDKYLKLKWFYKVVFNSIDVVLAQTQEDAYRLETLGAKNIKIAGNIKLATKIATTKTYQKPNSLVITAGSTHEKEEELMLDAFMSLHENNKKLIIAPRHPERFNSVDKIIKTKISNTIYSYSRFSEKNNFESDITLVDTLGELINIYAISDVVILGGGFKPMGGHNPIEPATFGCKIISGDKIFNQKSLFELVDNYILVDKENLSTTLQNHNNILPSKINKSLNLDVINYEFSDFMEGIKQ